MPQLTDVARKRGFLGKLWAMTGPYFLSREAPVAITLFLVVIAMVLGLVYVNYQLNTWYGDFQNMLQAKDLTATPVDFLGIHLGTVNKFVYLIGKFALIVFPAVILSVYSTYLRQMLQIRWRRWLTERFLGLWLEGRAYYRLQIYGGGSDNPEQRIEDDIAAFTDITLQLFVGVINKSVTLVTFGILLWALSGPITLPVLGTSITIPGYMVWIAGLYAIVGTYISYRIGRRLVRINYDQQRFRADFRFGMSRLKENAESVAMYRGEADEQRGLMEIFTSVWVNWWELMRAQKRLNWFQSFYGQAGGIFPILVIAPRYFAGAIDFGTIFRISQAFGQVSDALTWFMDNFIALAEWKATVNRLTGFVEALERVKAMESGIAHAPAPALETHDLRVALPDGRSLIENLNARVETGDKVLITGPSGSGKTTLFRALAGLWPFGSGKVKAPPAAEALFLPQRPYLPIGTLRRALTYPSPAESFDQAAVTQALEAVNLSHLGDKLDEKANWSMALSIGEQQRLAIARALLLKPDWLFLDEATSALDPVNEQRMYALLAERLPTATVLSIAHRPEVARFHDRHLTIDPATGSARLSAIAAQ
ncbi:MAG TPA: ABC transporter ATP-binding protein/permease [Dongiaceae bacterium]|nr:ABC transporter ATP-binding protein/permease [Dongiaceae bacterium]